MRNILFVFIIMLAVVSCSQEPEAEITGKQLNISVLTDLSDRIDPEANPLQVQKDLAIINSVIDIFKQELVTEGTFKAKGKLNFYFHPQPENREMLKLSENLRIDFAEMEVKEKKQAFRNFEEGVKQTYNKIYTLATAEKKYPGSDIFRFFADDIEDKCIAADSVYRNILVVVTDGYMFWEKGKVQKGNRYSYIVQKSGVMNKLRKDPNWESKFDKDDFGFIKINKNYKNLKVIVVEVNPGNESPSDYDIIRKFWNKWLLEMGIKPDAVKIVKTDLPANTKKVLSRFIKES